MPTPREVCSDCGGVAHEIRLIDKSNYGAQDNFAYTLPEEKVKFWTGSYPVKGRVTAFLCEACGRIIHYGVAND